jgi:hypothetical protein
MVQKTLFQLCTVTEIKYVYGLIKLRIVIEFIYTVKCRKQKFAYSFQ